MSNLPPVVEHVADNWQDLEKMILSLELVLLTKARALWEPWLMTGRIVDLGGFYRWMDDPQNDTEVASR